MQLLYIVTKKYSIVAFARTVEKTTTVGPEYGGILPVSVIGRAVERAFSDLTVPR